MDRSSWNDGADCRAEGDDLALEIEVEESALEKLGIPEDAADGAEFEVTPEQLAALGIRVETDEDGETVLELEAELTQQQLEAIDAGDAEGGAVVEVTPGQLAALQGAGQDDGSWDSWEEAEEGAPEPWEAHCAVEERPGHSKLLGIALAAAIATAAAGWAACGFVSDKIDPMSGTAALLEARAEGDGVSAAFESEAGDLEGSKCTVVRDGIQIAQPVVTRGSAPRHGGWTSYVISFPTDPSRTDGKYTVAIGDYEAEVTFSIAGGAASW